MKYGVEHATPKKVKSYQKAIVGNARAMRVEQTRRVGPASAEIVPEAFFVRVMTRQLVAWRSRCRRLAS